MQLKSKVVIVWIFAVVMMVLFLMCAKCFASDVYIDMDAIKQIESSGNQLAYNSRSKASGLYQITPIVLIEYNQFNKSNYTKEDLFNAGTNFLIADWYMNRRIPQMLKHFDVKDTVRNRIIAYNAGIVHARNNHAPKETISYIQRYNNLTKVEK